ncbi:septation protein A [Pseudahrensia aquimaris]|uniref:Inner membrane-spanning protein YciB n=1 Tax=Pseudahrensia aquimaris TaxID=744461 RepID=A0ABW3FK80_9HYPH
MTPKTENRVPSPTNKKDENAGTKMLLELGPVALFALSYYFGQSIIDAIGMSGALAKPIFLATIVLMIATPISIFMSWLKFKTLPAMPIVTLVVVSIFGGLTLYLQDDLFIKLKPTIINTLFGTVLITGWLMGKSWLKIVMGPAFSLDDDGWRKLTVRWGLFFLFLAVVNEVVWRNTSESFWVGFKLWGMTGLSMAFIITQIPMISRHTVEDDG